MEEYLITTLQSLFRNRQDISSNYSSSSPEWTWPTNHSI